MPSIRISLSKTKLAEEDWAQSGRINKAKGRAVRSMMAQNEQIEVGVLGSKQTK